MTEGGGGGWGTVAWCGPRMVSTLAWRRRNREGGGGVASVALSRRRWRRRAVFFFLLVCGCCSSLGAAARPVFLGAAPSAVLRHGGWSCGRWGGGGGRGDGWTPCHAPVEQTLVLSASAAPPFFFFFLSFRWRCQAARRPSMRPQTHSPPHPSPPPQTPLVVELRSRARAVASRIHLLCSPRAVAAAGRKSTRQNQTAGPPPPPALATVPLLLSPLPPRAAK